MPQKIRIVYTVDMRILLAILFITVPVPRLHACLCESPATPCQAAGRAVAAFTGTVLDITDHPALLVPVEISGPYVSRRSANRMVGDPTVALPRPLRVVRMQVQEVLSGVGTGQKEIEIVTGEGGGDCGYPFQTGVEYVVYAYKNAEGQIETSICSRTQPLAQADEDLKYFHAMADAPATGKILVLTGFPGAPGKAGVIIIAEREGLRYRVSTDAAGEARFTGLPPGEYAIHAESEGDLPDDPKVQLYAKGCRDVMLFRTLRIIGRVMTKSGTPAARVEVEVRPTQQTAGDGYMTDLDGHYELRISQPGQYYLGVNLNHTPTQDTPYPRWFYPGTQDQFSATIITFSGKPDVQTYDFTLPDRQNERLIQGIVLTSDGYPMPRAVVSVFDSSQTIVAQEITDHEGRFLLRVFDGISYQLHAVWPGNTPDDAASAVPANIQPGSGPLSLRLVLTQQGNSFFEHLGNGIREKH